VVGRPEDAGPAVGTVAAEDSGTDTVAAAGTGAGTVADGLIIGIGCANVSGTRPVPGAGLPCDTSPPTPGNGLGGGTGVVTTTAGAGSTTAGAAVGAAGLDAGAVSPAEGANGPTPGGGKLPCGSVMLGTDTAGNGVGPTPGEGRPNVGGVGRKRPP
jgi:hypothetical protein